MSKKVVKKKKKKKISKPPVYRGSVRHFELGFGLPSPAGIRKEMADMRDVLMGREDPPLEKGVATLMEVAEGYFSRACELEQIILEAQRAGTISAKDYGTLRTQELRSFKEMAKSAAELGSRRITYENRRAEQEWRGRESI